MGKTALSQKNLFKFQTNLPKVAFFLTDFIIFTDIFFGLPMRICPQKRYHAFVFVQKVFDGQDDRINLAASLIKLIRQFGICGMCRPEQYAVFGFII